MPRSATTPVAASAQLGAQVALAALVVAVTSARAEVDLRVERLSDTEVRVLASGTLVTGVDPGGNEHFLQVYDIFDVPPGYGQYQAILVSSTLSVGGVAVDFANAYGASGVPSMDDSIYFGNRSFTYFAAGAPVQGEARWRLYGDASFAPVGSSGDLYWGNQQMLGRGALTGSWSMLSSVPEPDTLALWLAGVALLGRWAASNRGG